MTSFNKTKKHHRRREIPYLTVNENTAVGHNKPIKASNPAATAATTPVVPSLINIGAAPNGADPELVLAATGVVPVLVEERVADVLRVILDAVVDVEESADPPPITPMEVLVLMMPEVVRVLPASEEPEPEGLHL